MNTRYGNMQNSGNNSATLAESPQMSQNQSQYQESSQADSQHVDAQSQPATSQGLQHQLDSTQREMRQSLVLKQ